MDILQSEQGKARVRVNVHKRFLALRKEVAFGRMTAQEAKNRLRARLILEREEALKWAADYWKARVALEPEEIHLEEE